jgi:hypothetical protein
LRGDPFKARVFLLCTDYLTEIDTNENQT